MVRLRKDAEDKILLEDCRIFEFDHDLNLDKTLFISTIRSALKQFCGSSKDLVIWVTPKLNRARLHHIKIPQVSPTQLPAAVYWGLQREEPFLEKETVVDFQVEEAIGLTSLNITGALAEREGIEDIQHKFTQAGYTLTGIGLPQFALCNLVSLRDDVKQDVPVLLCQLGQHTTSVSVQLNGRLVFTRDIPLGLENLGETLVKELHPIPTKEQACNLILKLGFEGEALTNEEVLHLENAFNLLRPILERAVRQIERTIQYYQSNFDTLPIETVFFGGEIAARGSLFKFISEQLPLTVIAIDPFDTPQLQANISLPAANADRIAYGPAFGLALEGYQVGINLAHTYNKRQNQSKHRKIAVATSVILMLLTAATVFFYNFQQSQLRNLSAEQDNLRRSLSALEPPLSEALIMEATEEVQTLQYRRRAAAKRYEGLAQLSEITRLTPSDISLLHISTTMGNPIGITEETAGTLTLKGVVTGERTSLETSLTIYVARLDQSHLFDTVQVDSTELIKDSSELNLTFTLIVKIIEESDKDIIKE